MDIFEQLENLNVSEECFDDILSIIEEYINEEDSLDDGSHIRRKYGKPEYEKNEDGTLKHDNKGFEIPANKSAKLYAKAHSNDNSYKYGPAHDNEGRGLGEYGKRVSKGESDRKAWVRTDTPKEIQEPLSVAKSQEKGARKLLNNAQNKQDKNRAKDLLVNALQNKAKQLGKKANYLNKTGEFDHNDYDNFEDNADIATDLEKQAQKRKVAAASATREARKIISPSQFKEVGNKAKNHIEPKK